MENYSKYLPTNEADARWGMSLLNTGCGETNNLGSYPDSNHPAPYCFHWNRGRLLHEYQLIYISKGKGIFESTSAGQIEVSAGSFIVLFPNEWHRYRPDESCGWIEYWLGFRGNIADSMVESGFFDPKKPLICTGVRPEIIKLYQDIIEQTRSELPGYEPLVSGMIVHLLGLIYSLSKQQAMSTDISGDHQTLVQRAMVLIRENTENKITVEEIADQLEVGYSLFRKIFKRHTGIAPGQYLIQLKINRAKNFLLYSDRLIKEIAYELNFESEYYFSKFFKDKTGMSPLTYKRAYLSQQSS